MTGNIFCIDAHLMEHPVPEIGSSLNIMQFRNEVGGRGREGQKELPRRQLKRPTRGVTMIEHGGRKGERGNPFFTLLVSAAFIAMHIQVE